jgi:4-hydroxybenzoate polyprenyltransferase
MKNLLVSTFKLIRIIGSIISATISGLLTYVHLHNWRSGVLVWLAIFFTITFGFAVNDYFDHEKDSIYPDKHVIAAGQLTRKQVGYIAALLFLLSAIVTVFLAPFQQLLNSALLLILLVYSWINNKYGIWANILVAICSSLSVLIAQNDIRLSLLTFSSVSVFFFITGREIIKDIHDVEADTVVGKQSLPISYGLVAAFRAALLLTLASFVFSVFTSWYYQTWLYLLIMVPAHGLYLYFLLRYKSRTEEKHYKDFSVYSKISFLMLIPALVLPVSG